MRRQKAADGAIDKEKPKKGRRRQGFGTIVLVAVFLIGISLLLYPTVADFWNQHTQTQAVAGYTEAVASLSKKDYTAVLEEARAYNERLAALSAPFYDYEKAGDYEDMLDVSGTGIMGYITIDRIRVELPIYHGTSAEILNVAVGHLEGSSLPVGGKGTHCALSAHRGLPSAKLFTDLDELREGDEFTITVLDEVLTYEVDQIKIVLPDDIEELYIDPDEDYCTLVTCTPYGLNTHRLLVRGHRVATAPTLYVTTQAYVIDSLLAAPAVAAPMLLFLLVYLMVRYNKKAVRAPKIEEIRYEKPKD